MEKEYKTEFATDEEAIAYYEYALCKQQTISIKIAGEPVLLCGTPLVDDIVENAFIDTAIKVTKTLNGQSVNRDEIWATDAHNTLIGAYYEFLEQVCGQRILYISEEF